MSHTVRGSSPKPVLVTCGRRAHCALWMNTSSREGIHVVVRGQCEKGSFHLLPRDPGDRALVRSDNRHLYLLSLLSYKQFVLYETGSY